MKSVVMAIAIGSVWLAMAAGSNSRSWTLDGTFAETNGGCPFAPDREVAPSFVQEDSRMALRLKGDTLTANGEAVFDLLPEWVHAQTRCFDVTPKDEADTVYRVPLNWKGKLKQLRIDFAAGGRPVTGTCRIDYIGLASSGKDR